MFSFRSGRKPYNSFRLLIKYLYSSLFFDGLKNGVSTIILIQISNFFGKPLEYFTSDATELLGQVKPPSNNSEVAPELNPELN